MNSAVGLGQFLGKRGLLVVSAGAGVALKVAVEVRDVREVFGRRDFRVRPLTGEGEGWVSAERVHGIVEAPQVGLFRETLAGHGEVVGGDGDVPGPR